MHRLLLACAAGLHACGSASAPVPDSPPPASGSARVLFVGNSLTRGWQLPSLVAALAGAAGDSLRVTSVTLDNASLDDHLASGETAARLRGAAWDAAVFQQGPTSTAEGGVQLVAAMERLAPLVRAAGGRPALYMAWPTPDRRAFWDVATANYARAAAAVDGTLLPVGDALRRALAEDPSLPLFEGDGFHLHAEGAYLAAIVLAAGLTGRDVADFPASVTWGGHALDVPPARLAAYRRAARAALAR